MKKNILIVGGSSSIGKEVIKNLKIKQYNIYATYNLNKIKNNKIKTFNVNLQNLNEIKKLIYNFKKEKIKFDNVIFLQGILFSLNLERYSEKKILDVFSINTLSIIFFTKELLKILNKKSMVVIVSSISGLNGSYDPIYSASKSALHGFVKSLSKWLAPKHRFVCLNPTPISGTKLYNNFSKKRKTYHKRSNPMKETVKNSDFAKIIIDILEPNWKHINGSIINISGGV